MIAFQLGMEKQRKLKLTGRPLHPSGYGMCDLQMSHYLSLSKCEDV